MNMGDLMKCDAVYSEPFWRKDGLNGFGISDHGAVRAAFDNCPANGSPGVLLAFVGGSTWKQYGLTTLAARRAAVLKGFAEMFGEKALHPIEYVEHDWTKERWTKGGPVAIMKPGTMTTYFQELRQAARAAPTGPAPRPRRTGTATWTVPCARGSVPPPRCSPASERWSSGGVSRTSPLRARHFRNSRHPSRMSRHDSDPSRCLEPDERGGRLARRTQGLRAGRRQDA